MKIAILTLPLNTNYGGILQAYALQKVLQDMGHEVEILQKIPTKLPLSINTLIIYLKRIVRKVLIDFHSPIFFEKKQIKEKSIIEQNILIFVNKYLKLRYINSLQDISSKDYEIIVVGSDQVWRKRYFEDAWRTSIQNAFLDFTKSWNIKRIAYAASFGKDSINEYSKIDIQKCSEVIKLFNNISVREKSGVAICREQFNVSAHCMLDPTMLLKKKDYIELIKKSGTPPSPGTMLCYILDPSPFKNKIISQIVDEKNLIPFNVFTEVNNYKLAVSQRILPSVEVWLRGFMDAELIVTDSFHACVFAIIFEKPFIVIGNLDRGIARINSLLNLFKIDKCLIRESSEVINTVLIKPDSSILEEYRNVSKSFLEESLY